MRAGARATATHPCRRITWLSCQAPFPRQPLAHPSPNSTSFQSNHPICRRQRRRLTHPRPWTPPPLAFFHTIPCPTVDFVPTVATFRHSLPQCTHLFTIPSFVQDGRRLCQRTPTTSVVSYPAHGPTFSLSWVVIWASEPFRPRVYLSIDSIRLDHDRDQSPSP